MKTTLLVKVKEYNQLSVNYLLLFFIKVKMTFLYIINLCPIAKKKKRKKFEISMLLLSKTNL